MPWLTLVHDLHCVLLTLSVNYAGVKSRWKKVELFLYPNAYIAFQVSPRNSALTAPSWDNFRRSRGGPTCHSEVGFPGAWSSDLGVRHTLFVALCRLSSGQSTQASSPFLAKVSFGKACLPRRRLRRKSAALMSGLWSRC